MQQRALRINVVRIYGILSKFQIQVADQSIHVEVRDHLDYLVPLAHQQCP